MTTNAKTVSVCCNHDCEQGDRFPARKESAVVRASSAVLIFLLVVTGALSSVALIVAAVTSWMKP